MSIFQSRPQAIADIRANRLLTVAASYLPGVQIPDDLIWEKLRAAEADLERQVRAWFTPREILPWSAPQSEEDALKDAGAAVEREAGYDYDPSMFQGNTWGLITLRQRPASAVHSIRFVYPAPNNPIYDIPVSWVRLDRKYGRINLVPDTSVQALPLNAYLLSVVGGGRIVPQMLEIRYRAGIEDAATRWPDLLDLIKKSAVLSLIEDQYLPNSASTSVDGLSQSVSHDADKHAERLEKRVETIRGAIHGIQLMVV